MGRQIRRRPEFKSGAAGAKAAQLEKLRQYR
jgi:hypothetical protein